MSEDANQDSGIVSSNEVEERPPEAGARSLGEITKAARAAAEGDQASLHRLERRIRPKLTEVALRLLKESDLELSAPELADGFLDWYIQEYRLQIQDRSELYELAERYMAQRLGLLAKHWPRTGDQSRSELARLLAIEEEDLRQALAERALEGVEAVESVYGEWVRLKLIFAQVGIAEIEPVWRELKGAEPPEPRDVLALFRTRYQRLIQDAEAKDLDTSADSRYREDDTLTHQPVPGESAPEKSPAVIEELRRENEKLRTDLDSANARIAELEERLGEHDVEASRSEVQAEVEALLDQPPLDDVPLLTGGSYEEQMGQLEEYYGRWLKHFGAEYDQVSLGHIRDHDPQGIQRLSVLLSKRRQREQEKHGETRTPTLGQIIPKESDVGDLALAGKTVKEVLADRRLARILSSRLMDRAYRD